MFLYFQAVWCVHGLSDWPRNQTHSGIWARRSGPDDLFGEGSRSGSATGNHQGKHHHYVRLIRSGGYLLICEISWVQFRLRGEGHVVSARGQRVVLCGSTCSRWAPVKGSQPPRLSLTDGDAGKSVTTLSAFSCMLINTDNYNHTFMLQVTSCEYFCVFNVFWHQQGGLGVQRKGCTMW